MNASKKYVMTDETKVVNWITLRRLKALRDIRGVKAGDPGGWIQDEKNLSHDGDCWVEGNAVVWGDAWVQGNAIVEGNARVSGNALVTVNARVEGDAVVRENAIVEGNARVLGNARVRENAIVEENAVVRGTARVMGDARVLGNAVINGYAIVEENAVVWGTAIVEENARVLGNAVVQGNARVLGNAVVQGNVVVLGNVWPCSPLCLHGTRHAVFTPDHDHVQVGCVVMTPAEWKKQYRKIGKENGYTAAEIREYGAAIQYAAAWLKTKPWNRKTKTTATKNQK